jgi:phosphate transport system permease protein
VARVEVIVKFFAIRKALNILGIGLTLAAVVLAIIPLGAMLVYVLSKGGSSLSWAFFTNVPAPVGEPGGGMSSQIAGTLYLVALASLIGMPIGIGSGIYLSRATNPGFARVVRFFTDVIAGTPSIIAGVVAYALIVIPFSSFSPIAGAVALALLMFPTVTRATEEAINLVPTAIREAGLALGFPEWKTMMRVVLPAAAQGIVTAAMLGVARVAGETAPLYLTVLGNGNFSFRLNGPMGALPLQIWVYATSPYAEWIKQAWAGAFVLFAIIVIANLTARLLTYRLSQRVGTT